MEPAAPLPMNKEIELKKAKRTPLLLLLAAACVFVVTAFMPRGVWVDGIKAVAEAAMVGALADWFAVVALFRRVPIPIVSAHTAIIPRNKHKIADNLAVFVQDKFLDVPSLVGLIQKHDPARSITGWLTQPANTARLGDYVVKLTGGILDLTDDVRIQVFIKDALRGVLAKVDLSQSMGAILDTLTKDGRHQELLDAGIEQVLALLREEQARAFIADRIVDWVKSEYPKMEKILPSAWLGEKGAEAIANAVNRMLEQISENPTHELRQKFDDAAHKLIAKLKTDPAFLQKGEELKRYLLEGDALGTYVKDMWGELRAWLKRDLQSPDSALHAKVMAMGQWVGRELAHDPTLRQSLNDHLEDAARGMAPDFAQFLTRHISDTVKNWDAREMSRQVELNIGKDLQYIRINGTIVGGFIGLVLYASSQLFELLRVHAG
ncbi:uncharacterized membrane-anchored protein YjiN (DUF445 family) [Paraburkholderia terricola]|jgi:uncharacterized membrane-anchored protein YjiN (DUF445 family)|uniref:Uncharacterized membrane-anchored protein YjiN (DUF445 family) n=2 Tax=Burkholderiaceae TaxID=119060 RepID=A0A1M6RAP9_9BURK|nr:uncharacterized membrane-anchored protein YjiN (DUF445 family) [Paraburkholderia terricola]SDP21100.1 Uncharacterized membrane-anchored protein YjiN, DUF445 family [Paraburkholderia sediminicola]MDR6449026.1 uncharacterized membrane-anchored protein YjiN (DUF445 family) [Paraburkholderia terricola]MDR6482439.1 uncharacterized membrane-anchored protein YjiN (DUF445 family) [Paraburkholderia terricola]MDR6495137.1 uncharacterized membrane-anchored protein YjiN (DUF445 family) [Paraburkholderia